jgi:hypothetical protein
VFLTHPRNNWPAKKHALAVFDVNIKEKGVSEKSVDFCQNSRRVIPEYNIVMAYCPDNLANYRSKNLLSRASRETKNMYIMPNIFFSESSTGFKTIKEAKTSQLCPHPVSYPVIRADCW